MLTQAIKTVFNRSSEAPKIPATQEHVDFAVHDNLLYDLIHSQNGTLATAIRELVMNAIDAGATECQVLLDENQFSVIDNGKGFASKDDIMQYFKTFGTPHDKGDAIHGRFRIGRGQVMAFGRIAWVSNLYKMEVDTKEKGFAFVYSESPTVLHAGCRVDGELYTPITAREIKNVTVELQRVLCYVPIKITINGKTLAVDYTTQKWDVKTEQYCIRYEKEGGVKVFSQGVYVKEFDRYNSDMRIGATVLTHQALALNMARNELSDNDALWQTITSKIREEIRKRAVSRTHGKNVSTTTRRNLIDMFFEGELDVDDVLHVPLFKDIRGFSLSIESLRTCNLPLTIGDSESRAAETVATRRLARVLDSVVLHEFTVPNIKTLLHSVMEIGREEYPKNAKTIKEIYYNKHCVALESIASTLIDDNSIIPTKTLSLRERAARNALQAGATLWAKKLSYLYEEYCKPRKLFIGKSTVADAWTNGVDTIVVSQHQLRLLDTRGQHAGYYFALLLLHEYLHNNNDASSHKHDFPFMEAFHDIALDRKEDMLGSVSNAIYQRYCDDLLKSSLPLPKKMLRYFKSAQVNDMQRVILHRNDAPLSKRVTQILQWLALPFERKKDRLIFSLSGNARRHTCAISAWHKQAKKVDSTAMSFFEFRRQLPPDKEKGETERGRDSYHRAASAYADYIGALLYQRFGDEKHTREFFVGLAYCDGVDATLRWLAKQPQLGISYVEWSINGTRRKVVNANINYCHSLHYPFHEEWGHGVRWRTPYEWRGLLERHAPVEDYAATKAGRLAYAKNIMQHAFAGLTNNTERLELARELLSETGCKALTIGKTEPEPEYYYRG